VSKNIYPNNLKYYRRKRKLTQRQVAENLRMPLANRLSNWENGTALPSVQNLIKLANLYKVSIDKLVAPLSRKMHKRTSVPKKTVELACKNHGDTHQALAGMSEEQLVREYAKIIFELFINYSQ
jgi:transcriptional regulator with XRE-family HTH domain